MFLVGMCLSLIEAKNLEYDFNKNSIVMQMQILKKFNLIDTF